MIHIILFPLPWRSWAETNFLTEQVMDSTRGLYVAVKGELGGVGGEKGNQRKAQDGGTQEKPRY